MSRLDIVPYSLDDNEAAIYLEEQCVQGSTLQLKYQRPAFHARSEVYDKYRILCAKMDGRLVGICAWAEKHVSLHGRSHRAAYTYDLRVLPEYRKQGVAIKIMRATLDDIGSEVDCIYTLIAGQNQVTFKLANRIFGMKTVVPLTYFVIPVYKKMKTSERFGIASAAEIHERYLACNDRLEFVPPFKVSRLLGYIKSIFKEDLRDTGCSLWTNENLLAEQVVAVPKRLKVLSVLYEPLRMFMDLPAIPKSGDTIRSWFIFDLHASSKENLYELLAAVNNLALEENRQCIYVLLQNGSVLFDSMMRLGRNSFTVPYYFLYKGRTALEEGDRIYIDIRDV